ncbi:hypothetical protein DFQ30_003852 [Apophysomyces sp. BC1015]|nr:hypothetical protein DFQ30_003852 [Apophysomyces sp. BC1015]KAG0178774.1 hypothetical protein DFQ29_003018 [Apophysomyces sp. BC1021]
MGVKGAGYGTRLQRDLQQSLTYKHLLGIPKALLPIGNRDALITHWLELFEEHGILKQDIHLVTNDACYDAFCTWADCHEFPLANIVSDGTTTNETRLGAVPDIAFGVCHFGLVDNVLVVGGDTLFLKDFDLGRFLGRLSDTCLVTTYQVRDEDVHKVGIVETGDEGVITSFLEKPEPSETESRSACPCFYLFHHRALGLIHEFVDACKARNAHKEEFDATGRFLAYLYPRFDVATYPISGRIDVGVNDVGFETDVKIMDVGANEFTKQESQDAAVIAQLTDLDGGFQCLLDKVKQDMHASKDAVTFLKKRAAIEEEYGKQMAKLSQSMAETFDKAHPRSGTYGDAWTSILKVHETIGEQRIKFAGDITEVADDLQLLYKDTEKGRKQAKEMGLKHEKALSDAEISLGKSKQKYEMLSEEWERAILQKNGETVHIPKKGFFKNNKTQAQLDKAEEDARAKATLADQNYRTQLQTTNLSRQQYFQNHLPNILTGLKAVGDECCVALRYQLARYAYIFEQAVMADGIALDNDDGLGIRSLTEKINMESDTNEFIRSYSDRVGRVQKNEIPYKEYSMSPTALHVLNPYPVFGVSLSDLMERDRTEVPLFMKKCTEAVEAYGLNTAGIYRVSGTNTQIQKLKSAFDRDCRNVNIHAEENISDINNITGLLKLWFRELPDPLFPTSMYKHFLNAAKIEDDRMRVLGLHTVINDLPDANYASLKYFMCHLDKVQQNQRYNKMGAANLATIFGLTLMGNDGDSQFNLAGLSAQDAQRLVDTQWQVRVVQTILENYRLIFEPDEA